MNALPIALCIGVIAGIVDVVPMAIQKLDKFACVSAFVHWVVLGLIIPYVNWDIQPWLKGLVIAELSAIPMMILVYPQDSKALIPMAIFSAILGAGVGLAGARFIG
ncbi:MAG: hypothetical protein Q8R88_06780 [Desulfoprunum sp.]|nr:hypothetical protein [Desulfoprunum sp.]